MTRRRLRRLRVLAGLAAGVVITGLTGASAAISPPVFVATSPHVYDVQRALISPNGRYVAVWGWDAPSGCVVGNVGCTGAKFVVAVYDLAKHKTHILARDLNGADVFGVANNGSVVYRAFQSWAYGNQLLLTPWKGKTISLRAVLPRQYSVGDYGVQAINRLTADGSSVEVWANGGLATQPLMYSLRTHKLWMPALFHHRLFTALDGQPSGDGKRIIFVNADGDKVLPHPAGHQHDVYVRSASRNSVKLITGGIAPGADLVNPRMSLDYYGRYAAITYSVKKAGPDYTNTDVPDGDRTWISVIDTKTARVVLTLPTAKGDGTTAWEVDEGYISGDGRYLVYSTLGDAADQGGGRYGIFRLDLQGKGVTQINPAPIATCTASCVGAATSSPTTDLHGSHVAFVDSAQLTSTDTDAGADAYVVTAP